MKILTVSELTQEIKRQLESEIGYVSVRGEVLNLKRQASGHTYFTLKDKDSQISAVLFRGAGQTLSRQPKDGDSLIIKGEITVYSPRGTYQILVKEVSYAGVGELLAQLHERKKAMEALGYFSKERKKPLPSHPKVIGVVTSPTGAVIQDIIQILKRRHEGFQLLLCPVKVQGPGAKEEIAEAINLFNKHSLADVLIVGRGGGSLEDLWAFNEEIVVKAVVESKIPIISAVGHETDFSLCDFAADVRAPTPSAAAELVLAEKSQHIKFLKQIRERVHLQAQSLVLRLKEQLALANKNPYIRSPELLLSRKIQSLDDMKGQLLLSVNNFLKHKKLQINSLEKQKRALEPSYQIAVSKAKLKTIQRSLHLSLLSIFQEKRKAFSEKDMQKKLLFSFETLVKKKKEDLVKIASHLSSIDPKNLLTKGYCILFSENRDSVILSARQLSLSQNLKLLLKDGVVTAKTENITYESL